MGKRISPSIPIDEVAEYTDSGVCTQALHQLTKNELQELLKQKSLPTSGNKDVLIQRLVVQEHPQVDEALAEELEIKKHAAKRKQTEKLRSEIRRDNATNLAQKVLRTVETPAPAPVTPTPVVVPHLPSATKFSLSNKHSGSPSRLSGNGNPIDLTNSSSVGISSSYTPTLYKPTGIPTLGYSSKPTHRDSDSKFFLEPKPEPVTEPLFDTLTTQSSQSSEEENTPVTPESNCNSEDMHEVEELSAEDFVDLMSEDFQHFKKWMMATQNSFGSCMKAFSQTTTFLVRAAKAAAKKRNSPAKQLKSCKELGPSQIEKLATEYGVTMSQVENAVSIMQGGSMVQFIGHIARTFKLNPYTGGIHRAEGVTVWNPTVLSNCKSFICRLTSGVISMTEAQKEIVSWARYERYKLKHVQQAPVDVDDE